MNRTYTDDEIRAILIERKRDRRLTIKAIARVGLLIGCGIVVWIGSWCIYAL